MYVTGWTVDQIRQTPAVVVRSMIWRIFAAGLWNDDLAQLARTPVAHRSAYGNTSAWAEAQRARLEAKSVVTEIEDVLWPEGES